MARLFFTLIALATALFAEKIETFYGSFDVEEPVLLELIHSPPFERLRQIHQYGVSYYTTFREEYTRYDHSLGVWAILRSKGAPLDEQIAGLLHDVSHTVFSHVGDWIFKQMDFEEDYQTLIHDRYIVESGLEVILKKHGYTAEQIHPKNLRFKRLEQPLPDLCADRIDYNIQGAFFQNFLTKEEALRLFADLDFIDGRWVIHSTELAGKLARFSLYMTEHCWGSAENHVTSSWLADAILHSIKTGLFTLKEIHFGVDDEIWQQLRASKDPAITSAMAKVIDPSTHYQLVSPEQAQEIVPFKCRGIDPWIAQNRSLKRLSALDADYARELQRVKELSAKGWPLKLN
jgi:HD superfamily phosphohydrolase